MTQLTINGRSPQGLQVEADFRWPEQPQTGFAGAQLGVRPPLQTETDVTPPDSHRDLTDDAEGEDS